MSCDDDTISFNNGDEVSLENTFREENADGSAGAVIDLTGLESNYTAEVWARGKKLFTLTTGSGGGIEILDPLPPAASDLDLQEPQSLITLTETQVETLPFGRIAYIKLILVDSDGVTTSAQGPIYLEKVLP